jgi:cytoskeletal protein CcmA (bactofilin family)
MFQKGSNKRDNAPTVTAPNEVVTNRKIPPTIISLDVRILGNVVSEGVVDIDGRVEGNVTADTLYIRENSIITGDIVAQTEVHVYGAVHGVIKARTVNIYARAHIEGSIIHKSLSIEDGAYIDAQFKPFDAQPRLTNAEYDYSGQSENGQPDEDYDILKDLKLLS